MAVDCSQLYTQYFDSVYSYVYFRLRNRPETEDLVSDIFLKAVSAAATYHWRPGASEKSWLFAIARNTLIDHYRKKRLPTVDVEEVDVPDTTDLSAELDTRSQFKQVLQAMTQLPDRQQEIIILRYQSDLSNTEIAKLLGITQSSVSAALTKATQTLKHLLTQPL